jgi:hypothetical protein
MAAGGSANVNNGWHQWRKSGGVSSAKVAQRSINQWQ